MRVLSAPATITITPPVGTFTTTFATNQDPISEGGAWVHQHASISSLKIVSGNAVMRVATDDYVDNYAYVSSGQFSSTNYQIDGTVFKSGTATSRELELMLRMGDASNRVFGYECLFNLDGAGVDIVRWNNVAGTIIDFLPIASTAVNPGPIADGDKIRAKIIGSAITIYHQPGGTGSFNQVGTANDSTFSTGQPGVAMFMRTGNGTLGSYGLKDFTVIAI